MWTPWTRRSSSLLILQRQISKLHGHSGVNICTIWGDELTWKSLSLTGGKGWFGRKGENSFLLKSKFPWKSEGDGIPTCHSSFRGIDPLTTPGALTLMLLGVFSPKAPQWRCQEFLSGGRWRYWGGSHSEFGGYNHAILLYYILWKIYQVRG